MLREYRTCSESPEADMKHQLIMLIPAFNWFCFYNFLDGKVQHTHLLLKNTLMFKETKGA